MAERLTSDLKNKKIKNNEIGAVQNMNNAKPDVQLSN